MFSKIKNEESRYYNKNKNYYVCSYGGSGSWLLVHYLSHFGNAYHIHSRNPPQKLTYIGSENNNENIYEEWFNNTTIHENELKNYTVIYLYRNPVHSIYSFYNSRFNSVDHLQHIHCDDTSVQIKNVIEKSKDLYGLEEFFENYTNHPNKNYPIFCVKYEDLFHSIQEFNDFFNLPNDPYYYPMKNETEKNNIFYNELNKIYQNLIDKMDQMKFIEKR